MKSLIPNTLTLSNLLCGIFAILSTLDGELVLTAYFIAASLAFDFLDGMVARALKVHSELGKQLDSLADMVSFGVVPGLIVFQLFLMSEGGEEPSIGLLKYVAFLIPLFSALRLAKFNIDLRQNSIFYGLPTPANTLMILSIALLATYSDIDLQSVFLHPVFLISLSVLSSLLLVAEIPLIALKFKDMSWSGNKDKYILLLVIALLFPIFKLRAFVFIIPLYLIFSLLFKPKQ